MVVETMDVMSQEIVQDIDILEVKIRQIRNEAEGINSYELVCIDGSELPPFTAGSHIDVYVGPGLVRQYSLSNNPDERYRYVIGVLDDPKGRGGSKYLHEKFRVLDTIKISSPRNHFSLNEEVNKVILIAGGIGITPLKSMAHRLDKLGIPFELHYCTRKYETVAFREELQDWMEQGRVQLYIDNGNPADGLDLNQFFSEVRFDTHVYYCGPAGFMKACADATQHWPIDKVKFEHFKAPESSEQRLKTTDGEFIAKIASTGQEILVKSEQTLSDALAENGVSIQTSCVSGLCGTCRVGYLEGEVEHHDYILSPEEQNICMTACVSRATSKVLVLDL